MLWWSVATTATDTLATAIVDSAAWKRSSSGYLAREWSHKTESWLVALDGYTHIVDITKPGLSELSGRGYTRPGNQN